MKMMNRLRSYLIVFLLIGCLVPALAFAKSQNIYVVDLSGEVSPGMLSYAKDAIEDANAKNADLILLNIDTLGGRVDVAERISRLILESKVKTVAYVNTKAESAGVLLSISANYLYMAPASTIGSAETIPNTEKSLSYWRSLLESTAEKTGRDPKIVAAMADSSVVIPNIVEKGKLLNLSNKKAEELMFSDGTMNSAVEIYKNIGVQNPKEIGVKMSSANKILGFLASSAVSQILLTMGIIGLVIEVITPGFGLGGALSLIGFGLFFAGTILSGTASAFAAVIFALGMILLIIELFAPGFGIFGVSGIICVLASIFMVSESVKAALISLAIAIGVTILFIALIIRFLPRRNLSKTLFLNTKLDKESGFSASREAVEYVGRSGKTLTFLRPSGKIIIDGKMLEATSQGRYIEKDRPVAVLRVEGSRLVVEEREEIE